MSASLGTQLLPDLATVPRKLSSYGERSDWWAAVGPVTSSDYDLSESLCRPVMADRFRPTRPWTRFDEEKHALALRLTHLLSVGFRTRASNNVTLTSGSGGESTKDMAGTVGRATEVAGHQDVEILAAVFTSLADLLPAYSEVEDDTSLSKEWLRLGSSTALVVSNGSPSLAGGPQYHGEEGDEENNDAPGMERKRHRQVLIFTMENLAFSLHDVTSALSPVARQSLQSHLLPCVESKDCFQPHSLIRATLRVIGDMVFGKGYHQMQASYNTFNSSSSPTFTRTAMIEF